MRYQCLNCEKLFVYPVKATVTKPFTFDIKMGEATANGQGDTVGTYGLQQGLEVSEKHVCPYCNSLDLEEYTPPAPPIIVPETKNVLVIDLTSGPQIQIDKALADGYKITARYSKQYIMEK